jgi:O-antigen ligase
MGRALFLAGVFLMVTGDWPPSTLFPTRWPQGVLAWPWLSLVLPAVSLVLMVAMAALRVARPTAAEFLRTPMAFLTAGLLLWVTFLAGIVLALLGDWPRSTLLPTRWAAPLSFLTWPWLYPAVLAVSCVLLVSSGVLRVGRPTTADFVQAPMALLTAAFLFSVAFSQVPALSQWAFGCFLAVAGFGLAVARIVEDETCVAAMPMVIAAAAVCLAVRVIVWRLEEGLAVPPSLTLNNAWVGKPQIAWVLNLLAPLLLARFISERTMAAAIHGAAWLLSAGAVTVLFSTTGAFTFALTTLGLCLLTRAYWRRWLPLLVGVTALAFGLIALSPPMTTHVIAGLIHPDRDPGIVMRQSVWRQTIQIIADHPVTGIGLGTYDDVAVRYGHPVAGTFFHRGWHAHNTFLHVFAETGTAGFLAWCSVWFVIVRFWLRRRRDGDGLARLNSGAGLCLLVAFVTLSMTEAMIAVRVDASLRMNLTLVLLVIFGIRLGGAGQAARQAQGGGTGER